MTWLRLVLIGATAASVPAQEPAEPAADFATLYRQAEALRLSSTGAEPAAVQRAYAAALRAFDGAAPVMAAAERAALLPAAAFAAFQAGAARRAADLFAAAIAGGHDDAFAAEWWLRSLLAADDPAAVVEAVPDLAARHPAAVDAALLWGYGRDAAGLCRAADAAMRRGAVAAGLLLFERLAVAGGRDPLALANWALALRNAGEVAASERVYQEALASAPDDADIWNDYGLLLKGVGRRDDAIAAFRRSLAVDAATPPTGPAISNLVLLQRDGGDVLLAEPVAVLGAMVARRPDAAMGRWLLLDQLLPIREAFPDSLPDTDGQRR